MSTYPVLLSSSIWAVAKYSESTIHLSLKPLILSIPHPYKPRVVPVLSIPRVDSTTASYPVFSLVPLPHMEGAPLTREKKSELLFREFKAFHDLIPTWLFTFNTSNTLYASLIKLNFLSFLRSFMIGSLSLSEQLILTLGLPSSPCIPDRSEQCWLSTQNLFLTS